MGITGNCAKFLLYAKKLGVSYRSTMMLGRQQLLINETEARYLADNHGIEVANVKYNDYSEPFFHMLGAEIVDSTDHSGFEKATVIHDLNKPLAPNFMARYSTVFDGGTLEHVFNFPQAIKSCMDLLQIGGHFISITPANNYCGHGFYQFSPELFFSLFNAEHGFKIALIAIFVELPDTKEVTWYKVTNPRDVKQRVVLSNSFPTTLMVLAEKIADTTDIQLAPFQSDYTHVWAVHDSMNKDSRIADESQWIHYYRKLTPEFVKRIVRKIANRKINKIENVEGLGVVNPHFFTKIEF